jgi:hypothetical protein
MRCSVGRVAIGSDRRPVTLSSPPSIRIRPSVSVIRSGHRGCGRSGRPVQVLRGLVKLLRRERACCPATPVSRTCAPRRRIVRLQRTAEPPRQLRGTDRLRLPAVFQRAQVRGDTHGPVIAELIHRDAERARGLIHGRADGLKAEARALVRFLERRFGTLPEHIRQRIDTADEDTLDRWVDQAATAERVEDALH